MNEKQKQMFETGSVWQGIFRMAIPAMITMLVMILYNMADMYFVGRAGDDTQVAAVSLCSPVYSVLMAVGSMLGSGGGVLLAKTLGQKDEHGAQLYFNVCCWGGVLFGAVFGVAVLLLREPLLTALGANEEILPYARAYLTCLMPGTPAMIMTVVCANCLRSEGAVKEGLLGNLLSTVANIVLDPLLIAPWGVAGAAIATALGNVLGAVYFIAYLLRGKGVLRLSLRRALEKPSAMLQILSIGLPNLVSSTLVGLSNAIANRLLVGYGTTAVAAMAAAGKSTMVISMLQMGLTLGVQPLLAYSYGARDLPRLREILAKTTVLTLAIGLTVSGVCFVGSRWAIGLFLQEESALALGEKMIRLLVLSGPFLGIYYICTSFLQASGNAMTATVTSMLRQGILLIPLLYVMNCFFGVTGNVCAHLAADIAACGIALLLTLRQYRILKNS